MTREGAVSWLRMSKWWPVQQVLLWLRTNRTVSAPATPHSNQKFLGEKCKFLLRGWNEKNFPNWGYSLQMERPISLSPEKWYQARTRPFPISLRLQCRLAWANGLLVTLCRDSLCFIFFSILRGCFWSGNTGKNTVCRQRAKCSCHSRRDNF